MKRKAILILHRKEDGRGRCICGAKMKGIDGKWICTYQYAKEEDSVIYLIRRNKP